MIFFLRAGRRQVDEQIAAVFTHQALKAVSQEMPAIVELMDIGNAGVLPHG